MKEQPGVPTHFPKYMPITDDVETDEVFTPVRSSNSTRRYRTAPPQTVPQRTHIRVTQHPGVPPRTSRTQVPPVQQALPEPVAASPARPHWLVYVGLAMLLNALSSWWQAQTDSWRYGYPRTFQCDAVVGHGDDAAHPSHFVALNLKGHIEVIEMQVGDALHTKIYQGPTITSSHADLVPVTLLFRDVIGDGKPDLIIQVQGSTSIWINTGTEFRPQQPTDHVHL